MSHIYELYSRDRTHPVRIYLLHEELFTEEEFFDLILESFDRSSQDEWHLQILEVVRYLVSKKGFREAGGLIEVGFNGDAGKNLVKSRILSYLGKDRSD